MKFNEMSKKAVCLGLSLIVASSATAAASGTSAPQVPPQEQQNKVQSVPVSTQSQQTESSAATTDGVKKSETVYVTLDAQGKQKETIVTDWLHSDASGTKILDKSTLNNIQNVKGSEVPSQSGTNLTWNLSGSDLYYRGTTNKKLPVDVKISYTLDGKEILPQDLGGKTGKVTIHISLKNTQQYNVLVNGKQATMYLPMMAIIGMNLSSDNFKNVTVSDGKIVSDGNNQAVVLVSVPGLDESLNLDGIDLPELGDLHFPEEFTITADATNFEMGNIGIALSSNISELDKLGESKSITEMKQSLYDLRDMQNDIEKVDPDQKIRSLFTDSKKAAGAKLLTDDVFDFYDMDQSLVNVLPEYITLDNIALYDRVKADAEKAKIEELLDNKTLRSLSDRLTDQNVTNAKLLLADYNTLQGLDMKKFTKAIDMLNDSSTLFSMLDKSRSLADDIDDHSAEINTLKTLMGYSGQIAGLAKEVKDSNLASAISEDDLQYMMTQLAQKKITDAVSLINDDGSIDSKNQETVIGYITMAEQAGALDQATGSQLIGSIKAYGTVGPTYGPVLKQKIQEFATKNAQELGDQAESLYTSAMKLGKSMKQNVGSDEEITKTIHFVNDIAPDLESMAKKLEKSSDDLDDIDDLINDEKTMKYLKTWGNKLVSMKSDMDANSDNINLVNDLLGEYDKPEVQAFKNNASQLQKDIDDVRPILKSLKNKLDDPVINAGLHKSPQTMTQLLKMKNDLENNRDVTEILRLVTDPKNVKIGNGVVQTLNNLESKHAVDDYVKDLDQADDLLARKDEYVKIAKNYKIFTDSADGMDTDLKFVMKTSEIKKPEVAVKQAVQATTQKTGFVAWCKNLIAKLK